MVELPWFWHQEQNVEQALWAQSNSPIMQSFGPGILLIGINWGCNINFYIGILIWPWYIGIYYIFISQRPEQARNVMSIENAVDKHQRSCIIRDGCYPYPDRSSWVLAGKIHHPNEMEVLVWHVTIFTCGCSLRGPFWMASPRSWVCDLMSWDTQCEKHRCPRS